MDPGSGDKKQGEHFQAAIARHQLHLQTELKRSTSLPSAMFDASDPMLEARLCAATEEIFRCLLDHDQPQKVEVGEQRLEPVGRDEIAALLRTAVAGSLADPSTPLLDEFHDQELPVLLAEVCTRSHGLAQLRAAELLRGEREQGPGAIDRLAKELLECIGKVGDGLGPHAAGAEAAVAAACRHVATTVLQFATDRGDTP